MEYYHFAVRSQFHSALFDLLFLNNRRSLILRVICIYIQECFEMLKHPIDNMRQFIKTNHLQQFKLFISVVFRTFLKNGCFAYVSTQKYFDKFYFCQIQTVLLRRSENFTDDIFFDGQIIESYFGAC